MKIRPLQDRVIVKRVEEEEKTKGGIIIPDTAKEKPMEGKVIAVGKGKLMEDGKIHALDVKAGDRVLFGKYSGTEVKIDGEEHLIMREDERGNHYPRHGQREAHGRQSDCRGKREGPGGREDSSPGCKSRRPGSLRQIRGNRSED